MLAWLNDWMWRARYWMARHLYPGSYHYPTIYHFIVELNGKKYGITVSAPELEDAQFAAYCLLLDEGEDVPCDFAVGDPEWTESILSYADCWRAYQEGEVVS